MSGHTHKVPTEEPQDAWRQLFQSEILTEALSNTAHGVISLWTPLGRAAAQTHGRAQAALETLAMISSLLLRPDNWNDPYGPAMQFEDRRSPGPSDLTPEQLQLLAEVAPEIPYLPLRARAYDVLSLATSGAQKIEHSKSHVEALLGTPVDGESWFGARDGWDRALLVARRYGKATKPLVAKLERSLRKLIRTSSDSFVPLQAADVLAKHNLALEHAGVTGRRLEKIADLSEGERKRAYLRGAVAWISKAGDAEGAARLQAGEAQNLIDEAEALVTGAPTNAMRAGNLYEQALQRIRQLPRVQRDRLGLGDLSRVLAQRIRELGALSLGQMMVIQSDPIDLSDAVREARERVSGKHLEEALNAYVGLVNIISIDDEIRSAESLVREHPLQSLFSNVHFSADGRIAYKSGGAGGAPIYGVDPAVWDVLIRNYQWRIDLNVRGALWPAWVQLTNEHDLAIGAFYAMVERAAIVPKDRTAQFARALYYGFSGDFSTAMQLLAPLVEAMVRYHFANAGELTSTIDPKSGTESEIGLSALMERPVADKIFTRDLAYEIRALFCGPIGPNVRNDVAHGLLSDSATTGAVAMFTWWFGLKLTFAAFWNSLQDVDSAEAREPRTPGAPGDADGAQPTKTP